MQDLRLVYRLDASPSLGAPALQIDYQVLPGRASRWQRVLAYCRRLLRRLRRALTLK